MKPADTLLLQRKEVAALLPLDECIVAVEKAFELYAEGKALPPGILGIQAQDGGFHLKAGILNLGRNYFVAKANANFPRNQAQFGLPTIQGVIVVFDARSGRLLAVMDSIEITIVRTGAATAVAAKYLSRANSKIAMIWGCGNQGRISVRMLMKVRPLEIVYAYDTDQIQAQKFAKELSAELKIAVIAVDDPARAVTESDICVTCTSSKQPFLHLKDVSPGTFIAAVGADSEEKQELESTLLKTGKLVVDLMNQSANIGELHHALQHGLMTRGDVYAELGEIICGRKKGRTTDDEVIIFDSTGTALQDVAAATIVYEKAVLSGMGMNLNFAE